MDFEREKPRKRKKKRNSAIIFLLFTTTLFAITLCIFFLFSYINQKNKTEEVILEIENWLI